MKKLGIFMLILIFVTCITLLVSCSSVSNKLNGTYQSDVISTRDGYFVYSIQIENDSFEIIRYTAKTNKSNANLIDPYTYGSGIVEFNSKQNTGYLHYNTSSYENMPYKFVISDNNNMILEFEDNYNRAGNYKNSWGTSFHTIILQKQ